MHSSDGKTWVSEYVGDLLDLELGNYSLVGLGVNKTFVNDGVASSVSVVALSLPSLSLPSPTSLICRTL